MMSKPLLFQFLKTTLLNIFIIIFENENNG
jgi:hypothetical protein